MTPEEYCLEWIKKAKREAYEDAARIADKKQKEWRRIAADKDEEDEVSRRDARIRMGNAQAIAQAIRQRLEEL